MAPIEAELMENTDKYYNNNNKKNVMRTLKGMQLDPKKKVLEEKKHYFWIKKLSRETK